MQAIIVKEFGSADQLLLSSLPDLTPGKGEVIIDVEAAGVGLVDVLLRQGLLGVSAPGYIPGIEVAGRVSALGAGVDQRLVGKRVFALGKGGYAQQFVAGAEELVELPDEVTSQGAVALGVNALVARFSIERARLQPGERVLVRGASGGIGSLVAQMGLKLGAEVTAVTSSSMADRVAALGVRRVLERGTNTEPPGPFDVIIDPVAGDAVLALINTLAPNGRYVVNGAAAGYPPAGIAEVMLQSFRRSPTYSLLSLDSVSQEEKARVATALFAEAARGELSPLIAQVLPLHEAAIAHKILEAGDNFGKLVLQPKAA
jgi:NADPH2:quinone reductase